MMSNLTIQDKLNYLVSTLFFIFYDTYNIIKLKENEDIWNIKRGNEVWLSGSCIWLVVACSGTCTDKGSNSVGTMVKKITEPAFW